MNGEEMLVSVPAVLRFRDELPDDAKLRRCALRLRIRRAARLTWPEREVIEAAVLVPEGCWAFRRRLAAILQNHVGEW